MELLLYNIYVIGYKYKSIRAVSYTHLDVYKRQPFDSSFPSGHTLNGITAAVTLMFIDKRMGIPAIVLAVLIAFSRMYNFMHFPTDVMAGAVLGVVSAVFVNFLFKRAGN